MDTYKVYVKLDKNGTVIAINSNAFLQDLKGWIEIDEGGGDKFHHAQGNYLPKALMDERGRYRYKLVDGAVVERTPEELGADAIPACMPSEAERLAAVEAAVLDLVLGGGIGG